MSPQMKNRAISYAIAIGSFLGVFALAAVIAWGALPEVPQAPLVSEDGGVCPDGSLVQRTVYDTDPGGEGFYATWTVTRGPKAESTRFLVVTRDPAGVLQAWVALPGRETQQLSYEQLTARYAAPCDIAALVVGAP